VTTQPILLQKIVKFKIFTPFFLQNSVPTMETPTVVNQVESSYEKIVINIGKNQDIAKKVTKIEVIICEMVS
jgi:hypothetical protein